MVDAGENINKTLKREFCEEALSCQNMAFTDRKALLRLVNLLFQSGVEVILVTRTPLI